MGTIIYEEDPVDSSYLHDMAKFCRPLSKYMKLYLQSNLSQRSPEDKVAEVRFKRLHQWLQNDKVNIIEFNCKDEDCFEHTEIFR